MKPMSKAIDVDYLCGFLFNLDSIDVEFDFRVHRVIDLILTLIYLSSLIKKIDKIIISNICKNYLKEIHANPNFRLNTSMF
jgi:hypothetical protein